MAKVNIRLKNGKLFNVKDVTFVEVCNDEGMLSVLVYLSNSGAVHIHTAEDEQFKRYSSMYKRKAIPETRIDDTNNA